MSSQIFPGRPPETLPPALAAAPAPAAAASAAAAPGTPPGGAGGASASPPPPTPDAPRSPAELEEETRRRAAASTGAPAGAPPAAGATTPPAEGAITDKHQIQQAQAKLEALGLSTGDDMHGKPGNHTKAQHSNAAAGSAEMAAVMDGKVGHRTRAALKEVQHALGLPETSQLDAATLAALNDPAKLARLSATLHPGAAPAPARPDAPATPAPAAADDRKPVVASSALTSVLSALPFSAAEKAELGTRGTNAVVKEYAAEHGIRGVTPNGALTQGEVKAIVAEIANGTDPKEAAAKAKLQEAVAQHKFEQSNEAWLVPSATPNVRAPSSALGAAK